MNEYDYDEYACSVVNVRPFQPSHIRVNINEYSQAHPKDKQEIQETPKMYLRYETNYY